MIETGTTTLAISGRDGVVLAADTRASLGGAFVTNRRVRKIEPIGDRAAVAFSGRVSDAQTFVRQLRAESRLYELRHGYGENSIPLEVLATLAGNLVRDGPYQILDLLLAGVDGETGGERNGHAEYTGGDDDEHVDGEHSDRTLETVVYDIDPGGGVLKTDYAANGSGMQLAYGALEGAVDPSLSVEELHPIAASAVKRATARDTASGDGMTITTITREKTKTRTRTSTGRESRGDVVLEIEEYDDLDAIGHLDVETAVGTSSDGESERSHEGTISPGEEEEEEVN